MYFWDSRRLTKDLRNDAVPASTLRDQFIGLLIIGAPVFVSGLFDAARFDRWDVIYLVGAIAIVIFGIQWAYRMNGGDEGRRFVEKSVALLLPVTIQSFVLMLVVFMGLLAVESALDSRLRPWEKALMEDVSTLSITLLLHVWVMWRLGVHLADTLVDGPDRIGAVAEDAPTSEGG